MAILPGFDQSVKPYMTSTQYGVFVTVHLLLILFYAILTVFVGKNIWYILVKQGRWRTFPLLVFYIFVFIAVVLREITMITICVQNSKWVWAEFL